MKLAKVVFLTAGVTLLAIFFLGLLGTVFSILKFVFWTAVLLALLALAINLFKRFSAPKKTPNYQPQELEAWDKMFEDYKQNADFKSK